MLNLKVFSLVVLSFGALELITADVNIVKKAEWNGQEANGELNPLQTPVESVIILHTATMECNDLQTCSAQVRSIQKFHMVHWFDIGYNYMIGNDGNVYEGRGWDAEGAHTKGYNANSLGIAFLGTFTTSLPSDQAIEVAKKLLETGVTLGKIKEDYKLFGARQLMATESPGAALYQVIKQWPHWSQNP